MQYNFPSSNTKRATNKTEREGKSARKKTLKLQSIKNFSQSRNENFFVENFQNYSGFSLSCSLTTFPSSKIFTESKPICAVVNFIFCRCKDWKLFLLITNFTCFFTCCSICLIRCCRCLHMLTFYSATLEFLSLRRQKAL